MISIIIFIIWWLSEKQASDFDRIKEDLPALERREWSYIPLGVTRVGKQIGIDNEYYLWRTHINANANRLPF